MVDRAKMIKAIHVAKRAKGIDEETYRAMLQGFGVTSSTELRDGQLGELLTKLNGGKPYKGSAKPYVRKVFALWGALAQAGIVENGSKQALTAFVKRTAGVDNPEFLLPAQANKVIEGLKAMQERGAPSHADQA
ncbi:MAG: regulatory protein GemA [Alphaproteobacteria bacterium]|nr:regulatory protein GemA [Alphaproteobacteria bacterium]